MIRRSLLKKPIHFFIPFILFVCFAALLFSDNQKVRVKVEEAVIRFDPSTRSSVVANAKRGDILDVVRTEGEWYSVTFTPADSGFLLSGYVMASDVEIVAAQLPAGKDQFSQVSGGNTAPDSFKFAFSKKIISTTANFKYDYDTLGIVSHVQIAPSDGRDPVKAGIRNGMEELEINVIEMEGDAVVGLNYDVFTDPADNRLKVLIYGTVIKFK
jgi:hypothetical protein